MEDDGLPNARPIALSDSPRCQRSHNSVFSAAVKPRRYPCHIAKHSIFSVKIKCCVDQLRPPTTADKGGFWPATVCPLMTHLRHRPAFHVAVAKPISAPFRMPI